jgi:surface protein
MFHRCGKLNSDVSDWNVASATELCAMFDGCTSFNSDVSRWNVANATNLSYMFNDCTRFNSDISRWNVANATVLCGMFSGCVLFDSDVSRWNVAAAMAQLQGMFYGCGSFQREHVTTWALPDEESVAVLFGRSVYDLWDGYD